MCIRVDTVESIPIDLIHRIDRIRPDLEGNNYIDELARRDDVVQLLGELNEYLSKGVIGIHYTRSFRDCIQKNGLQLKSGQERRERFLDEYSYLFTPEEVEEIRSEYSKYFTDRMNWARDNKIWFCLSEEAMNNGGAARLLEYYGGEAVYMPLTNLDSISNKIRRIGEPLIVKCRLNPKSINGCWEYPVALVWLSAYHASINPKAKLYDVDVWSTLPIRPEDILAIEIAKYWRR